MKKFTFILILLMLTVFPLMANAQKSYHPFVSKGKVHKLIEPGSFNITLTLKNADEKFCDTIYNNYVKKSFIENDRVSLDKAIDKYNDAHDKAMRKSNAEDKKKAVVKAMDALNREYKKLSKKFSSNLKKAATNGLKELKKTETALKKAKLTFKFEFNKNNEYKLDPEFFPEENTVTAEASKNYTFTIVMKTADKLAEPGYLKVGLTLNPSQSDEAPVYKEIRDNYIHPYIEKYIKKKIDTAVEKFAKAKGDTAREKALVTLNKTLDKTLKGIDKKIIKEAGKGLKAAAKKNKALKKVKLITTVTLPEKKFAIDTGKTASEEKAVGYWDWNFGQGQMLKKMKRAQIRRTGGSLKKLYNKVSMGICLSMCYNWLKRRALREKTTAETYTDVSKFKKLAEDQADYVDFNKRDNGLLWFANKAADEGLKMSVKTAQLSTGSTAKHIYAIDHSTPGLYFFCCYGENGAHAMAMEIDSKGYGTYFDPNFGQFTVTKADGNTLGEMVSAMILDEYLDDYIKKNGAYRVIRLDVKSMTKLKKAGFLE